MSRRLFVTLLAAFIIGGGAVLAVALERLGGREVYAELLEGPGVREGSEVTYLGIRIGFVRKIDLASGRVVLTLHIDRSDVVLQSGDGVRLRPIGVFGERMVEIVRHPGSGRPLGPADTLREVR